MIATLLSIVLAAAPYKLAVPTVSFVNLDAKTGGLYLDYFSQQLSAHPGVSVVTEGEMNSLLGLERQKQLLGCASQSCTAELAGALGVDALVTGSLAKAGGGYVVNLKVIRSTDGTALAVFSTRVATEDALFDYLKASADQLARQLQPSATSAGTASGTSEVVAASPTPRGSAAPWLASAAVAAGALGAGAAFFGIAGSQANSLAQADPSLSTFSEASARRYAGETNQAIGLSLMAAGGAAALTALAVGLLPRDSMLRRLTPGVLGLVAGLGGAVLLGIAHADANEISSADPRIHGLVDLDAVRAHGEASQAAGLVLIGAGIVGLASTALLWLVGGDDSPLTMAPTPGGAAALGLWRF